MISSSCSRASSTLSESGGFDPLELCELIGAWSQVSLFAAPTMVKRLVEHPAVQRADCDNLRAIVFGGAPMYLADLKTAIARLGFKLAQLYGQGESPMTITGMTRAMIEAAYKAGDDARLRSAGVAQSVVEVRVAGGDDRPVQEGAVGEILCRGDSVMKGYWRNPEATAETLRGGWLHTGDMGSFDAGMYLTLHDRSKDLIITGGANVYPREVEEVLRRHPGANEVSVIGVPDPEWGESVVAYVVAGEGARPNPEELDRLCLDHIARFKRPRHYRFIAALPKSNYGKILKVELRALWAREREARPDPNLKES